MFSFFKRKKVTPAPEAPRAEPTEPLSPPLPEAEQAADPASGPEARPQAQIPAPASEPQARSQAQIPAPAPVDSASSDLAPASQEPVLAPAPAAQPEVQASDAPAPAAFVRPEPPVTSLPEPEPELEPEPEPEPVATPDPEPAPVKSSWLSRLKQGLSRTGQSIGGLFVGAKVDENLFEELEEALLLADAGVDATEKLLTALRARIRKEKITDAAQVKQLLCDILTDHLKPLEKSFPLNAAQPLVVMIAGVNGAGKTTSIGKLAHAFQQQGASVLLAAGDTFRAAAREQLIEWGARNNVSVIAQDGGDPAAVAFDAVHAGKARGMGVVMVDTAGRLPTQLHLMEELKKIKRVIAKADGQAPHEVLLVVDGNTGQNAISQIRAFDAALGLTGLVVTKLDGTAKGGTLAAVAAGAQGVRPIPVYWIGVGEGMQDLQPFVAREFAAAVIGLN